MNSTIRLLSLVLLLSLGVLQPATRALAQAAVQPAAAAPQPVAAPPIAAVPPAAAADVAAVPSAAPVALAAAPSPAVVAAEAPSNREPQVYVAHAPVSETESGALSLWFAVEPSDRVEAVIVRWRARTPDAQVHEAVVGRTTQSWAVDVHDEEIAPPGIAYWVVRRDPGPGEAASREHAVFASEAAPHPVAVFEGEVSAYERRALALRGGRRYRAGASFEYVSLGQRDLPPGIAGPRAASYWRSSVNFGYSFFGVVDAIRFELGALRGEQELVGSDAARTTDALGFNWGSGELLFRLHELVRVRSRLVFGVSQSGFELGGALALVVGEPEGTGLEVGFEGVTGLGVTGRLRLGWATVPRVPMGATIELTNFPTGDAAGVRLLFDAGYELYPGALLRVTGGYRGWTSVVGGPSLAADLLLAF